MEKKKSNILAIVIMFFLFAMISFVTGLQNPFGIIVKSQFHASNAMSQLGNLANFIAYLFMGLPAGFILKKKGYKVTALIAVAIGFIGVGITFLSGVAASFAVYLLGAFISGFSMCILNTVVNPMLNTLGGGGNRGNQLIQYGGSLNSLSATIVPVFVGYLIGDVTSNTMITDANPALYIAMGIFALAFFIILFSRIPEPELEAAKAAEAAGEKSESTLASVKGALSFRHFLLGIIAIFIYVGVEVSIPSIANLYMTSEAIGISAAVAGSVVGMYWLLMFVGRLIGGVVGGKVSSRTMMITVTSVAIVFLIAGMILGNDFSVRFPAVTSQLKFTMAEIPVGVMFFVLCGLCTSVMWGSIFNLSVEGLGRYTSIASGLFMMMVFGGGVLPVVQGAVADNAGYIASYIVTALCVAYMLWYALFGSKVIKKVEK
ncbi:MAG: MFS transporter [Bacteroidales bacterium]|jgi:FHS family L-fucose permease-like MFS transporter|nr:MFS transporter [Bacteroidales bacterium]MCI1784618.1 MFS transporter [Bacteroidales bacterium]